jgi:hypothetical protein
MWCAFAPRYEDGDEDRAFLMSIRRGEQDLEALVGQLLELRAEIDVLKLQLPEKTDPRVLGEWLLYLRRTHAAAKRAGAHPTSGAQQDARARALCPAEGSSVPLRDKARDLLRQFGVEGEILCCIPSGSTAHGLGTLPPSLPPFQGPRSPLMWRTHPLFIFLSLFIYIYNAAV